MQKAWDTQRGVVWFSQGLGNAPERRRFLDCASLPLMLYLLTTERAPDLREREKR